MPTNNKVHDLPGTMVAAGFLLLGVFLITRTTEMTPLGSVFPIAISGAMIVFSALLVIRNVMLGIRGEAPARNALSEETAGAGGSTARRVLFLVAMSLWIALLPVLGFMAASVLGFFAIMAVATHERLTAKELAILVAISLAILAGFYLLMAEVLLIPMPRGLFF